MEKAIVVIFIIDFIFYLFIFKSASERNQFLLANKVNGEKVNYSKLYMYS